MGRPTRASRRAEEEPKIEKEEEEEELEHEEYSKKAEHVKKAVAPKKAIKAKEEAAAEKKKEEEAKKAAAADKKKKEEEEETEDEDEDEEVHKEEKEEQYVDEKELEENPKMESKNTSPNKASIKDTEEQGESNEVQEKEDPATKEEPREENKVKKDEEIQESDEKKVLDDNEPEEKKESEEKQEGEMKKEPEESKPEEDDPNAIWQPTDFDVLSGRGASVNSHGGNKKFRALCFARKPEFEAGNHAAKRRIATEIVVAVFNDGEARFLKRKNEKGPWLELNKEQAILKACQVMRDYKRPDRLALREMLAQNGQARKRSRQVESTPMLDIPVPSGPLEPIIENPFGVHDHDILCGRGAFVNGHIGNQRLRKLALERKTAFDAGNYTEKRSLANEIVTIIKALDPPGRFLKRASKKSDDGATENEDKKDEDTEEKGEWEELNDEKSIHKACQVMRDIDRPDRKDREERRAKKKQKLMEVKEGKLPEPKEEELQTDEQKEEKKEDVTSLEKDAVEEAVAATEAALDKALDKVLDATETKVVEAESVEV